MVGIFPDTTAVIRLVGAIMIDMHDEWIASERRYLSELVLATANKIARDGDCACGGFCSSSRTGPDGLP